MCRCIGNWGKSKGGPSLLLIIMSYIIFCEENIYNRVSFDRMATVIRSQRIIGDVIVYYPAPPLFSFSLVCLCRCGAVQTTSSSAVVDRPSPRLALWTTRQEDLDVVDLSRLFVGCLRLHYRLITWCQRFASCFLLFFYKKCQTHKWTDNNWNEWRDDWRKLSLNLTIDTKNLYTNINWFVLNIIM